MKVRSLSTGNIFENKYLKKKLPKLNSNYNFRPLPSIKNYIFKQSINRKNKLIDNSKKSSVQQSFIVTNYLDPRTDSSNRTFNLNELKSNENQIKKVFETFEKKKLIKIKNNLLSKNKLSLTNKLNDTNLFKFFTENKNNITLMFVKNKNPIAALINRKEINKIPISPNLPLTYKNKFANHSEYNRFMKFNEELLKLREQITIDSKNSFKYLKEFINFYGIKDECYYKNNCLCNLSNFIKSDFVNNINPNFSLQQNLINALNEGAIINTGYKEDEKLFISPFIKNEGEDKKYIKIGKNIKNKIEIMSVISLEKQKQLNERLN
jgi:hypothetical protein